MGSLLGSEIDRLDKVAAKFGRTYAIGPDNLKDELDGNRPGVGAGQLSQRPRRLQPVHDRHTDIRNDDIRLRFTDNVQ